MPVNQGAPQVKRAPEHLYLPFLDFKAIDEAAGTFAGHLAVKNNIDQGRDRVRDGAFLRTINGWSAKMAKGKWMPVLWQHDPEEPIGGFTKMVEDEVGLYVEGFLDMDIAEGRRAYSGLKKGYISGLSMGYETEKAQPVAGVRDLLEVKLWEGSVVTFPMNEEAGVESIKSATEAVGDVKPTGVKASASIDQMGYSMEDILCAVGEAIRNIERIPYEYDPEYTYARYSKEATYSTFAIAEDELSAGQLYKIPYSIGTDGVVALGTMEPVQVAYVTTTKAVAALQKQGLSESEAKHLVTVVRRKSEGRSLWAQELANMPEAKAGRRNSTADVANIHTAVKAMTTLLDPPDIPPVVDHLSGKMTSDDLGPCMQQMAARLDDTQRAALLSALQPSDSGAKSRTAPAPAAAGSHAGETKGASSDGGPAAAPEIERLALETMSLLQKAAGLPVRAVADPEAEAMALLTKAATNLAK